MNSTPASGDALSSGSTRRVKRIEPVRLPSTTPTLASAASGLANPALLASRSRPPSSLHSQSTAWRASSSEVTSRRNVRSGGVSDRASSSLPSITAGDHGLVANGEAACKLEADAGVTAGDQDLLAVEAHIALSVVADRRSRPAKIRSGSFGLKGQTSSKKR